MNARVEDSIPSSGSSTGENRLEKVYIPLLAVLLAGLLPSLKDWVFPPPTMSEPALNTDLWGHDIGLGFQGVSDATCSDMCLKDADCAAMTFCMGTPSHDGRGGCYLKSAIPTPSSKLACTSVVKLHKGPFGLYQRPSPPFPAAQ